METGGDGDLVEIEEVEIWGRTLVLELRGGDAVEEAVDEVEAGCVICLEVLS